MRIIKTSIFAYLRSIQTEETHVSNGKNNPVLDNEAFPSIPSIVPIVFKLAKPITAGEDCGGGPAAAPSDLRLPHHCQPQQPVPGGAHGLPQT
jgi:hypothetical protein